MNIAMRVVENERRRVVLRSPLLVLVSLLVLVVEDHFHVRVLSRSLASVGPEAQEQETCENDGTAHATTDCGGDRAAWWA